MPKKDVVIKIHFFPLIFSPINIELIIIAIGIDNWAPITIGDKIFDALTDKYKNRFTDMPIEIPKPNLPNILTLKTNINIQTVFVIIFGNKNYLVPEEQNRNFRQYIDDHSKKMVNLIESRIYVGRPVK